MNWIMLLVIFAALLGLGYACINYYAVKRLKEGSDKMKEIAQAIRTGAGAFIRYEYKIVAIIATVVAVLVGIAISWEAGIAFIIGATMSALAGYIGMKIATYANVRVANEANETKDTGKTLKVAFKGGSVMGLSVASFALLGIFIVYMIFGVGMGMLKVVDGEIVHKVNLITKQPYTMSLILSGYALGCSIIAMFNRVGGGIYTKAADMGADLVGKTEAHIPEDDPRNPATIADNVGDNVGDVAGLGSDLLESYVGSILATAILAIEVFAANSTFTSSTLLGNMIMYPMLFAGIGLIGCIIGIASLLIKKNISNNPHKELNMATWLSAGISMVGGLALTLYMFKGETASELKSAGFALGMWSPWVTASLGIVAGIVIGILSEYYTSYDFKPTINIANASKEGSALTITQGMANGMISTMLPVAVLAITIYVSYIIGGTYGVGCGALGMLSFVATTVSVDTYGPISDNAGGIAEMSGLDHEVRNITDKLDSVGNTTAAIGKGFAIGSAALATVSMMSSYLFSFDGGVTAINGVMTLVLNILSREVLAGALLGAALPYLFSGMLINAVAKAARAMVSEVRRQFKEIPGILEGTNPPDYKTCIEISSKGALREMIVPAIISISFPVVCGLLFGPELVGGLLIGATLSAIMLALFSGNSGGAWDNAKKFIEAGGVEGCGKGSEAHDSAVVGDTVGDPLKDTVGPSLDILIKIMSTVSLVCVVLFEKFNFMGFLGL